MTGTTFFMLLWGAGGLVGALLGHRIHRSATGLFLGAFLPVLGWVMILEARPRLTVGHQLRSNRE
jgi:uncharacterized membrane protein YfcA